MNQRLHIIIGPLAAVVVALTLRFFTLAPTEAQLMSAVVMLMAWWWMTEAVPLAVTSLLPVLLLPVLGIATAKETARQYMDNILFLFIGGFILAFALEKWNLHKRIAYMILSKVGTKPSSILLGVMLTSFFISMWISNTATVMLLLAAVMALVSEMDVHISSPEAKRKLGAGLLIGLAYSASIGGLATLVGTPTNMIFYREYQRAFPAANDMDFMHWVVIGFPAALLLLLTAYLTLRYMFCERINTAVVDRFYFRDKLKALGKWSREERIIAWVFLITVTLWFTRSDLDFGSYTIPGWASAIFGAKSKFIEDSTVAILAAIILFLIPASDKKQKLIEWKDAERLPFDIILLFGGGFALAYGFEVSGLSEWVASGFSHLKGMSPVLLVFGLSVLICIISEFASNVASIQLMIPVLLAGYQELGVSALFLLVPATLSASLGFMLPVATAPNTIVFGTKRIRTSEMMRAGLIVDIAGVIIITLIAALVL